MTPQEKYLRQLVRTLLQPGEQVRQHAVVSRKTRDGIEAGLYFAAWTNRRLLLILTKRNGQTGLPKRVNLGVEEYERSGIEKVFRKLADGVGRLCFRLSSGLDLDIWVSFSEQSVSGQRAFFDGFGAASQPAESSGPGSLEAGSLEAGSLEAGSLEAESLEAESLEAELSRLEGFATSAFVQPAPPVVPIAHLAARVPPLAATTAATDPFAAEAYPLVRNEMPRPAEMSPHVAPAKPVVGARRGGGSGGVVALLLALAGTGLVMFLGCAGLLAVGFVTSAGRSSTSRFTMPRPSTRGFTHPQAPPTYTPPTYTPPKVPQFRPPTRSGIGGTPSPGQSFRDSHRDHMDRMQDQQEAMSRRIQEQMDASNRRHEEMMQRMRRSFP